MATKVNNVYFFLRNKSNGGGGDVYWGDIGGSIANQTDLQNALAAKQDKIDNDNKLSYSLLSGTPSISTDIVADKESNDKIASPKAVYSFVGDPIVSLTVPTPNDGTVIFTHRSGDTTTLDLNHQHLDYPKYYECSDEAEYAAIQNKDAGTLYLIPES